MSDDVELRTTWATIAPASPRSQEIFDDVVGRHRQAHRRYHGVRHVVWVLRHARALEAAIPACAPEKVHDAVAVSAAAFFHDAVYDPQRAENEERSAVLADHQLASIGWDQRRRDTVAFLIRATATHLGDSLPTDSPPTVTSERQVMLDADLAVLGSSPSAYAAYATGVRGEYGHLDDHQWATGRAGVLRQLLDRAHLYESDPARQWWEMRARANLTAELAAL